MAGLKESEDHSGELDRWGDTGQVTKVKPLGFGNGILWDVKLKFHTERQG